MKFQDDELPDVAWTTSHDGHGGIQIMDGDIQVGFLSHTKNQEQNSRIVEAIGELMQAAGAMCESAIAGGRAFDEKKAYRAYHLAARALRTIRGYRA